MASTSRYGLRARERYPGQRPESAPRDDVTVEALLFVGLKPKVLTKPERQAFGGQMTDYISVRWGRPRGRGAAGGAGERGRGHGSAAPRGARRARCAAAAAAGSAAGGAAGGGRARARHWQLRVRQAASSTAQRPPDAPRAPGTRAAAAAAAAAPQGRDRVDVVSKLHQDADGRRMRR
jgi:hypothetical protein